MVAVINHLHFTKPVDDFQAPIANEGLPILSAQPGFEGFYFVKEAADRGAVIILWRDAQAAADGAKVFGPTWFAKNLFPFLASEQVRSMGEVLVQHPAG